ncbi:MAG: hypothetical protein KAR06_04165 [Deltaproteobacteria bacterium]|nr:hypothetical protein [Deltaproteobacteria bacterium]
MQKEVYRYSRAWRNDKQREVWYTYDENPEFLHFCWQCEWVFFGFLRRTPVRCEMCLRADWNIRSNRLESDYIRMAVGRFNSYVKWNPLRRELMWSEKEQIRKGAEEAMKQKVAAKKAVAKRHTRYRDGAYHAKYFKWEALCQV